MQINGVDGYKRDVTWNQIISIDVKTRWSSAHSASFRVRSKQLDSLFNYFACQQTARGTGAEPPRRLFFYLMTTDSWSQAGYEFQFGFGNNNNYSPQYLYHYRVAVAI